MKKLFPISLTAALLLGFSAIISAQKPAASPSPSPAPVKLERETKFDGNVTFPEVEGWELSPRQNTPVRSMGYFVNYESPSGRVSVYVYNADLPSIPNSLTGVVAKEMKDAKSGITMLVDAGMYESAKEVKNETVTLGGPKGSVKSLHAHFALRAGGRDLDSHIYLFPYHNYFIKIRMTNPQMKEPSADVAALFEALDLLFSK